MELKITRKTGDETTVDIDPATEVAFEDTFDMAIADVKRNKHLYWLGWKAEFVRDQAAGKTVLLFDDWIPTIKSIDAVAEKKGSPTKAPSRS